MGIFGLLSIIPTFIILYILWGRRKYRKYGSFPRVVKYLGNLNLEKSIIESFFIQIK